LELGFSEEELSRYARQICLSEIGPSGQERLRQGRVLMCGLGGLGSPGAYYLAAAGVGVIGLVDGDRVEASNLQRQILHTTAGIGRAKVDSAKERLHALNPNCRLVTYQKPLDPDNIMDIIKDYDIIIDGLDNFPTRLLVNEACLKTGKVFIHGGVQGFSGQVMTIVPGQGPCLQCLLPQPPWGESGGEAGSKGVLGVLPGTIGTIQATEALKYLLGQGDLLIGRLLFYSALDMRFVEVGVEREPDCMCSRFDE
jgi:adenylyltransferase/sulfurtransferase